jgi:hypothetical protein
MATGILIYHRRDNSKKSDILKIAKSIPVWYFVVYGIFGEVTNPPIKAPT